MYTWGISRIANSCPGMSLTLNPIPYLTLSLGYPRTPSGALAIGNYFAYKERWLLGNDKQSTLHITCTFSNAHVDIHVRLEMVIKDKVQQPLLKEKGTIELHDIYSSPRFSAYKSLNICCPDIPPWTNILLPSTATIWPCLGVGGVPEVGGVVHSPVAGSSL